MNPQFNQELEKFADFILDENELGIVIGNHQNLDTVAAALALFLSLKNSGKNVQIASIKDPLVEVSSLVGVDKIKRNFAAGNTTKLVVALPYIKGEVEKVLFTEQTDTINFHLTAAPGRTITPFELDKVKLIWEGGAPKAIIAVGVGNENELSELVDITGSRIVNIDNYQNNSRFGEIVLVEGSFSSLSEIIGKILKDQRLPMDPDVAQNILDGVLFATRNFTKPNTSPAAFEAASNAMYQGAQRRNEDSGRPQVQRNEQRQNFNQSGQRPYDVAPRNQQNPQRRDNRSQSQNQNRGSFGHASFDQSPFDAPQGKQGKQNQKVNPNDFPAMHIQDIRNQIQNDARMQNQRPFDNSQGRQRFNQSPFDQDSFSGPQMNNTQVRHDRQPKRDQNMSPRNEDSMQPPVQDAQIVDDMQVPQPQMQQTQDFSNLAPSFDNSQDKPFDSAQDKQMPEPQSFNDYNEENVPDDWLMPKVFKSSKNNN